MNVNLATTNHRNGLRTLEPSEVKCVGGGGLAEDLQADAYFNALEVWKIRSALSFRPLPKPSWNDF
jgi:hypothetical protein